MARGLAWRSRCAEQLGKSICFFSCYTQMCTHHTTEHRQRKKTNTNTHSHTQKASCPAVPPSLICGCTSHAQYSPIPSPSPFLVGVGRLFPWSLPGKSAKFVSNSAANFFQMAETCRSAANLPCLRKSYPAFYHRLPGGWRRWGDLRRADDGAEALPVLQQEVLQPEMGPVRTSHQSSERHPLKAYTNGVLVWRFWAAGPQSMPTCSGGI